MTDKKREIPMTKKEEIVDRVVRGMKINTAKTNNVAVAFGQSDENFEKAVKSLTSYLMSHALQEMLGDCEEERKTGRIPFDTLFHFTNWLEGDGFKKSGMLLSKPEHYFSIALVYDASRIRMTEMLDKARSLREDDDRHHGHDHGDHDHNVMGVEIKADSPEGRQLIGLLTKLGK